MRKLTWLIVVGVVVWWALNGLISTLQWVAILSDRGMPVALDHIVRSELANAALWVPCTLWLLWWSARTPLERERWLAPLAWLLFALVTMVVFRAAAVELLDPLVDWYRDPPPWGEVLLAHMLNSFLRGSLIVGVGHALVYAQRARARERQAQVLQERLTQARLDALSAQLNPHFLFNALNSIAEMVHHDADAADRMLVQLGGVLRYSLEASRRQLTSLREELDVVDCYIGIEQVRLGERLQFRRDIDEEALSAQVPRLMLLPLLENAVAHAVAQRASPSTVLVRARCEGGRLHIEVLDEGADAPAKPGFGLGLANTRGRLECLYGQDQSLDMEALPNGGTRVRVSLPLAPGQGG